MNTQPERRRHARIAFDTHAILTGGQEAVRVRVIDISFRGVLVQTPPEWVGTGKIDYRLDLPLNEHTQISMNARLARCVEGQAAFQCIHIDLDSMMHLRRLLELNMGDEMLVQRELMELGR